MAPYEAVLFDFDGVLADTEPVHFECWAEAVRPYVEMDWETYRTCCIGITDRGLVEFLAARAKPPVPVELLWERYPRKRRLFEARMEAEPPISPAVIELITSLREYKLAVVTSSALSEIEPALERAGIGGHFGTLVCREDVTRHKPAPEPYLLAAERLGVRRALVVEDSEAGLASGRAAGLDVLYIPAAARTPDLVRARLGIAEPGTPGD